MKNYPPRYSLSVICSNCFSEFLMFVIFTVPVLFQKLLSSNGLAIVRCSNVLRSLLVRMKISQFVDRQFTSMFK